MRSLCTAIENKPPLSPQLEKSPHQPRPSTARRNKYIKGFFFNACDKDPEIQCPNLHEASTSSSLVSLEGICVLFQPSFLICLWNGFSSLVTRGLSSRAAGKNYLLYSQKEEFSQNLSSIQILLLTHRLLEADLSFLICTMVWNKIISKIVSQAGAAAETNLLFSLRQAAAPKLKACRESCTGPFSCCG